MEIASKELTGEIIAAAIEVHRNLGPGLLESAYEEAMCYELAARGIPFCRRFGLPLIYKGTEMGRGYEIDIMVAGEVVVELKAVETMHPIYEAQILTYLKLSGRKVGLLINFNVVVLKDGIRRFVL